MAVYNEILTGRHNRFSQKLFGIKGPAPTPQVSSEIVMQHPISHGAENRYLESWERFAAFVHVAAVAANQSAIRLRNPAGSNVVIVIEQLLSYLDNSSSLVDLHGGSVNVDLAIVPNFSSGIRLDARGRQGSGSGATLVWSSQASTPSAPGGANDSIRGERFHPGQLTQSQLVHHNWVTGPTDEFPILPGDYVQLTCFTVDIGITANAVWRERQLEESERF